MYMKKRMNKKKVDEEDVIMMIITRMRMKINFVEILFIFSRNLQIISYYVC